MENGKEDVSTTVMEIMERKHEETWREQMNNTFVEKVAEIMKKITY